MTVSLNTRHFNLPPPVVPPVQSFQFPKPISYNFRVLETTKNGKIVSVGLQVQVVEHDEYGAPVTHYSWQDVPRVQQEENT